MLSVSGLDTLGVYGDPFRLRQALDNLVSNAVKYTPAGGRVSVGLGITDGGLAELTVIDTGAGIAPADLERLFEPYFRSADAVASGAPGTGLGLNIVLEIIEDHGGELVATSEFGKGTVMRALLPRRQVDAESRRPTGGHAASTQEVNASTRLVREASRAMVA